MGKLTPQKQLILGFEAGHKKKGWQAIGCIMTGQNLQKRSSLP
jgi:hypothetical protein